MATFSQAANIPAYNTAIKSSIADLASIPIGTLPLSLSDISFIASGFASALCFTSTGNASSATFTITGTYDGNYITENVTGPNNTTVCSVNFYDTIISITSNVILAAPIKIGYASNVIVRLVAYSSNYNSNPYNGPFNFFVSNLTAATDPDVQLFGISNTQPQLLQMPNFDVATRPANFQLLVPNLTQAQVNVGYNFKATYPYSMAIVMLYEVTTPTYVEIIQA
jgi:hypothetical protein